MNLRLYLLLCASLLLTSCSGGGLGLGSGNFRRVPVTDYFLVGAAPAGFTGASAADAELTLLATELTTSRAYMLGLFRQGDRFDIEVSEIESGRADSVLLAPAAADDTSRYLGEGTVTVTGNTVQLELAIPTAGTRLEQYGTLQLTGSVNRAAAQDLIDDVRTPAFEDNQSAATADGQFTLSGTLDGQPFTIGFTQTLRGFADTYFATV